MSLIRELKRRNVFRTAAAYLVLAWLVLQVSDVILNNVDAPRWIFHVILLLLGIGFLFTLLFSWAFELTPEGLKREHQVDRSHSITRQTGRKLNRLILGLLVLAVGYFAYDKFYLSRQREAVLVEATAQAAAAQAATEAAMAESDKSIAVLPFVNLSSDPEQEYFSDGISEELLNVLAKVPDLQVTSRSSAFAFKGKDVSIPEIARQLGVAHVLEGSVRKSGMKVRITAQLIEAGSDKHLWSETYDRNLDDIFAIQDEISAAIVDALVATMGLEVVQEKSKRTTRGQNTEAYTTYLLGLHQMNRRTAESFPAAKKLFQKAIEQDSDFAPAYAQLAILWMLEGVGYGDGSVSFEAGMAAADPLIERAMELDPELADAYAAKGLYMRFQENTSGSIQVLQRALALNPSHSRALNWLSMSYRVQMRSRDELEILREGHKLDPLAGAIATNLVKSLSRFQLYDEADLVLEDLKALSKAEYGFSKSEAEMLRGRYAEAVVVALGTDDSDSAAKLTLHSASYLLAAMGEQTEALRLDPWHGEYAEFTDMLNSEIRDPDDRLAALKKNQDEELDLADPRPLIWAYLGAGKDAEAEVLALHRLEGLNPDDRNIDGANLAMAVIEWRRGNAEEAQAYVKTLEQVTGRNLADGDNISLNHLIQAMSRFFRGDESTAFAHLQEGFSNKAPMSFEGENLFAIYTAMGWDQKPEFRGLLDAYEERNLAALKKVLATACAGQGFAAWQPLPETCAAYSL